MSIASNLTNITSSNKQTGIPEGTKIIDFKTYQAGDDMMSSETTPETNRGTSARSLNDTSSPPTASFHIGTTFSLTSDLPAFYGW